jgi:hypothetical protein
MAMSGYGTVREFHKATMLVAPSPRRYFRRPGGTSGSGRDA